MEREIRHKIKKGDLTDIPKEVLETMAPSLLAPGKGKLKILKFLLWQFSGHSKSKKKIRHTIIICVLFCYCTVYKISVEH